MRHSVFSKQALDLLQRMAPVFGGVRYDFPEPEGNYETRLRNRFSYFNQLHVYMRECSATGKRMLTRFSPLVKFPVYDNDYWWSDAWDPRDYARDFDFSRPFFEQFFELRDIVPHLARSGTENENCEFVNNANNNRNGYLIFNTANSEDCMYGENVSYCTDCVDCTQCKRATLCFECIVCSDCYDLSYSSFCDGCNSSAFLLNCRSCKNCFCCSNLSHREYCIFNQQYSRADYEAYLSKIDFSSYSEIEKLRRDAAAHFAKFPQPHLYTKQCENVSGNILHNVRDAENSYLIFGGENLVNCYNLEGPAKDCLEFSAAGIRAELIYQSVRCGIDISRLAFCVHCLGNVSELLYCTDCRNSQNSFACVGLKGNSYCIFNKQFSPSEYDRLVSRIIAHMRETGEWGRFFPEKFSYIPYNHSIAQRF